MGHDTSIPPVNWLPARVVGNPRMAFLPDPNDFIGRAETGEPALCCVPEDDPHNIVRDALREGDIIEFEGV